MRRQLVAMSIGGLLIATPAYADVGIPLIACIHPGLWFALPIVMLMECVVAVVVLRKGIRTAAKVAFLGNLLSTLVGVALKWLLVWSLTPMASAFSSAIHRSGDTAETWGNGTLLQKFAIGITGRPGFGAWGSADGLHTRIWMYWAVLLISFFLLSVWVEWRVAVRLLGNENRTRATRWAWIANGLSYALLAGLFWRLYFSIWWWIARP